MNKNYVPAAVATKIPFAIGLHDEREVVDVTREGASFYLRKDENEIVLIGDLRGLAVFLYENQAEYLVERKKKFRRRSVFLNKLQAMELLREGVPVFHLESGQIFSYSDGYEKLLTSASISVDELLPGIYMVALGEPRLEKTYKEVNKENEAARRLRRKFASQTRTMVAEEVAAAKPEAEKVQQQTAAEPPQDKTTAEKLGKRGGSWWKVAAAFGGLIVLGGGFYYLTQK